jgi:FKBP-type peptidyl-prolyl cis-trans isomerase FklB
MRIVQIAALGSALLLFPACGEPSPDISADEARLGYSIGYQVGGDFRRQRIPIDPEIAVRGLKDALNGSTSALTKDEMRRALTDLQKRVAGDGPRRLEEETPRDAVDG